MMEEMKAKLKSRNAKAMDATSSETSVAAEPPPAKYSKPPIAASTGAAASTESSSSATRHLSLTDYRNRKTSDSNIVSVSKSCLIDEVKLKLKQRMAQATAWEMFISDYIILFYYLLIFLIFVNTRFVDFFFFLKFWSVRSGLIFLCLTSSPQALLLQSWHSVLQLLRLPVSRVTFVCEIEIVFEIKGKTLPWIK